MSRNGKRTLTDSIRPPDGSSLPIHPAPEIAPLRIILLRLLCRIIALLLIIPLGYAVGVYFAFMEGIPATIRENALQLIWLCILALVAVEFIEDWLERLRAAARSQPPKPPSLRRLQDLAPWLQAVSVSEDAAVPPALSPPLRSRHSPARD